jgi:hypothetical protein
VRSENSLSNLERALLGDFVSTQDMDLKLLARFNTFEIMGFGYIGKREKDLGLWSRFEKNDRKNDSVTEIESIKAKREIVFSVKSLCEAGRKYRKQLRAPLRMNSEFNLEENILSKWCKSRGTA